MISVSDLGKLAGNRLEFHKLLVRCGFVLPSAKSEAATLGWMYEIFKGNAWCPKESDLNIIKQVADPPRRDVVSKIVVGLMSNASVP